LALGLILTLAALFWLRTALYNRFVRFPEEAAAWKALGAEHQPVPPLPGWHDYRGVFHSHSHLSHDCEVPFPEILRVLKATGRDFIGLSDHCDQGRADFSAQWRGLHDGVLFIPGFEMKDGLMPFGVASNVILDSKTLDSDAIARLVIEHGGVLFYAHPEEPRDWNRPELTGTEIYNIHADFTDHRHALLDLLPDLLVNQRRYPDHVFRLLFDPPTANLARWDACNQSRHLTGIAGNDCHQNTGVRAVVAENHTVRIEDTSPKTLAQLPLNALTRPLLRLAFGPLEPGRVLCRVQLDPYERMVRFVCTHVLAPELSETAILDALRSGHAFVGFDRLADSSGFLWTAHGPHGEAIMGDSLAFDPDVELRAASPQPCRFTIVHEGRPVHTAEGRSLEWKPNGPGSYRVEAHLRIRNEWVPWVYANPIALQLRHQNLQTNTPPTLHPPS